MPAPRLGDLVAPEHTALVTQECQGGVVGPDAGPPVLAAEAELIGNTLSLLATVTTTDALIDGWQN